MTGLGGLMAAWSKRSVIAGARQVPQGGDDLVQVGGHATMVIGEPLTASGVRGVDQVGGKRLFLAMDGQELDRGLEHFGAVAQEALDHVLGDALVDKPCAELCLSRWALTRVGRPASSWSRPVVPRRRRG